ncbi:ATP-binding cassette domain-containing protein [Cryobacterium sp. M15]|uniref:branched-chain amino acid ABC transporter ATP-binding protein/permease n=1 Tax=Cryobacterium sp. M15 TaxID=2048291 RepID=UPI000CE30B7A|nr:branched-chain amino acid ABC transporter ATP-binding protein/permease [Cryobacterium sp. M15]
MNLPRNETPTNFWTDRMLPVWIKHRRTIVLVGSVVALLMALSSAQSSQLLALILIYAVAVSGWNIVSGYAGQPSLGHAAFFGLGAYGAAVWTVRFGQSPWIGIALGAITAGILAMLVGCVSWRLKISGIYFALILFAVSELLFVIASNIKFLGGTTGLFSVVSGDSFTMLTFADPRWFAGIAAGMLGLILLLTTALSRSQLGRQWAIVRHDEVAAEASGINTMRVKVIALGISAVITAMAGGLYAQLQLFIQPDTAFGMQTNLRFILIGFLGGVGLLWGPLVGSTIVTMIETVSRELFRGLPGIDGVAFGLVLVLAVTLLPRGLAWRRSAKARRSLAVTPSDPHISPSGAIGLDSADPAGRDQVRRGATVFTVADLSKTFGAITVVNAVSMTLSGGTIHGLIGPNGAGKSTMINMLTGTIQSDTGEMHLEGRSVFGRPPHEFARAGIARTFQIPRPLGDLTVRECVLAAATATGRSSNPAQSTDRALKAMGMAEHADRLWVTLNGSQQRRVEVARALSQEPRVLLLDEPMSGLGAEEIDALVEVIRQLRHSRPEMTILLVEHLMRIMMTLADQITVLDRGRVIARGTPSEINADRAVIDAYLGSSVV